MPQNPSVFGPDEVFARDNSHRSRTHLALDKDAPDHRPVQRPEEGTIVAVPQLGGLHHRYERLAA